MMTVQQLRDALANCHPDMPVRVRVNSNPGELMEDAVVGFEMSDFAADRTRFILVGPSHEHVAPCGDCECVECYPTDAEMEAAFAAAEMKAGAEFDARTIIAPDGRDVTPVIRATCERCGDPCEVRADAVVHRCGGCRSHDVLMAAERAEQRERRAADVAKRMAPPVVDDGDDDDDDATRISEHMADQIINPPAPVQHVVDAYCRHCGTEFSTLSGINACSLPIVCPTCEDLRAPIGKIRTQCSECMADWTTIRELLRGLDRQIYLHKYAEYGAIMELVIARIDGRS